MAITERALLFSTIIILFFVHFGSSTTTAATTKDLNSRTETLKSRTEWLSLLKLRSSLGIRKKDWPKKSEPCKNWTGIHCMKGSVIGINVSGLKRTHKSSLHPDFAVDSLSNFTLLESFNASGFVLNGSIPVFGENNTLQVLDLSSSSIFGSIPESIGDLGSLKILLLSGNGLVGRIPSNLGKLKRLSELNLTGNYLSGSVPFTLTSLLNLKRLDLSSNSLSGYVPPELFTLTRLEILNLSNSGLSGSFPSKIGNFSSLVKVDLSMNFMSGSLPESFFSGLSKIEDLILSGNAFVGAVPVSFWSLPSLRFVDLSGNNLTGTLPEFSDLNVNSTGAVFNLSNNMFYGNLSISVKEFRMIDLSGNYLQGEVQGVGDLGNVRLARNCFLMVPNQRDSRDCRMFYVQRNLPFAGGGSEEARSRSRNNKRRVIFILAGIFGGFGLIVLLVLVLILVLKRCGNSKSVAVQTGTENRGAVPEGESTMPPKDPDFVAGVGESFTYDQIHKLTGNFAEANIIKRGHSGDLFWGVLENGATVVVKRVDLSLFKRESYIVELALLSKVSHAGLVPILGHCLENENEKCIVYKYMPNGDLATSLHRVDGTDGELKSLDWITRLKIAIGAAEGLAHLHECSPPIVHRDVQASSILLDDKFEVRLGSLSEVTAQGEIHQGVISRLFSKPSSSEQVNLGTSPVTSADDVYCFGKILLELVTGNVDISKSDDTATREWLDQTLSYITIYDKDRINKIVDPSLIVDEDLLEEVWAMAIVARSCLNPRPAKRPPMRHVLKALENPLKVVREESASSVRLRTTSSRRSWSIGFFGSWRQSSSGSATATNRESSSGSKQSLKVNSQGSGGNDHSSSNKRSSNEVFPEPLETHDVEAGEAR